MIKSLTEKELLETVFTPDEYQRFAMKIYKEILSSETYKNDDKIFFSIQSFQIDDSTWLHVEATLKGAYDFGFVKFVLSDEDLLDFTLDRWNEVKRQLQ